MEAGGSPQKKQVEDESKKKSRRKKMKKRNSSSDSHRSKSSGEISFVLARKSQNYVYGSASIFGDGEEAEAHPNSGQQSGGFGMFSLGLMMVMCCVSSQVMVEAQAQGAGSM